ncbi:MAG: putative lipid II flippase FtsW [Verrucomicrobia bacterium]|nr:putative lipid II flippase FtsW [Verrucomicrobiota bacterium]
MRVATTILVFCVGALLALGMVMLFSAKMMHESAAWQPMAQVVWCGLGLIAGAIAIAVDYRKLKKFAIPLLVLAVVLLLMVFIPDLGRSINGAYRWIKLPKGLGGLTLQPSEMAKLALIIFMAYYCERFLRQMHTFKKGVMIPALVVGGVLGLIFIEPDVGTTMLLAAVCSIMLLLAGLRWRYFIPPVLIGCIAIGAFIYNDPMRSERIYAWLNLEETKRDKGAQAYQAKLALGAGGLTGLGLGNGRQKLGFIPENHTDFIFSIVGEELGLIATIGVVLAFVMILFSGVFIASRAPDMFGMLLASGITFMISIQAFINIGVVTNFLPNKGMSLPFISYGGSNLLVMLCSIGLLLSVARQGVDRERTVERRNPFNDIPGAQEA